jgi:BirA family biotin operon repressor/biotin-[acetyl-CoA-carboxylase] ligase
MGTTPLSFETLTGIWNDAGLRAPVRFDEVTGSTNATAAELARGGAPEWTVVAAAHQTAGRGRLGRAWSDRSGAALLVSIVLRPDLPASDAGAVGLLAGAALAGSAAEVADAATGCKWPNDVLVAGRKAAGILVEGAVVGERPEHLVLGIGVNLGEPPVPEAGAVQTGAAELLAGFLDAFVSAYRPADAGFVRSVVDAYRPWCVTLGRRVRTTTVHGAVVEGEAVDLDERGALLVDTAEGIVAVAFGEVEHVRPGPSILD